MPAMHSASQSKKILRRLPLFAGAAIAGGGLTLLVACDFDRVSKSYLLPGICSLPTEDRMPFSEPSVSTFYTRTIAMRQILCKHRTCVVLVGA